MIAWVFRLAKWSAIMGGILLVLLTLMIVASVSGRALIDVGLGPVPGDFELVEIGTAVAVFFFLPWTYLRGGHATVDILYSHLPGWAKRAVVTLSDLLMLALWLVLTWRLWEGMLEKRMYMESTFILQMPVWWAYALCLVGAVIGCLAYIAKNLIMFGLASYPAGWPVEEAKEH
ncbi:TRAP transporter small permease [Tepidicella xavieri]|jgi:TRAP-type C4-dicarboxylate transport system permease small subunit|uniref:TRAP transporter small permease protein n=1 Tax=Tepidicella xavieri TaxID=360241 RepID=A0A4R6UDJ7_9BURK|nr:TRAP transporter small permease [Tepidicella xavieri]TDQ44768.1 TRAP-type C4-dicarboxylate transport system permease small subunit [Tepidicella xavieri]